jgi:hypothetical protein
MLRDTTEIGQCTRHERDSLGTKPERQISQVRHGLSEELLQVFRREIHAHGQTQPAKVGQHENEIGGDICGDGARSQRNSPDEHRVSRSLLQVLEQIEDALGGRQVHMVEEIAAPVGDECVGEDVTEREGRFLEIGRGYKVENGGDQFWGQRR